MKRYILLLFALMYVVSLISHYRQVAQCRSARPAHFNPIGASEVTLYMDGERHGRITVEGDLLMLHESKALLYTIGHHRKTLRKWSRDGTGDHVRVCIICEDQALFDDEFTLAAPLDKDYVLIQGSPIGVGGEAAPTGEEQKMLIPVEIEQFIGGESDEEQ